MATLLIISVSILFKLISSGCYRTFSWQYLCRNLPLYWSSLSAFCSGWYPLGVINILLWISLPELAFIPWSFLVDHFFSLHSAGTVPVILVAYSRPQPSTQVLMRLFVSFHACKSRCRTFQNCKVFWVILDLGYRASLTSIQIFVMPAIDYKLSLIVKL